MPLITSCECVRGKTLRPVFGRAVAQLVRACSCKTCAFAVYHLHLSVAVRACVQVFKCVACAHACVWWHLLSLPKASSPAKRLAIGDAHLAGSWLARRPQRSGLQGAAQRVPRYPLRMRAVVGVVHNFPLLPNTKFSDSVVKSVFTRYYSHGIRTSPGSPAGYHDGRPACKGAG